MAGRSQKASELILGICLIALSIIIMAINVLDKYLSARKYDPLGLDPTAIRIKGSDDPKLRWIAIPDGLTFPARTTDYVYDLLNSESGNFIGRGTTARRAVKDLVDRHLAGAEEIDLTY